MTRITIPDRHLNLFSDIQESNGGNKMATRKDIESALKELSASQGGSLVKEVVKSKMKDEPVLFISLGGLGCKTLDMLEATILREYEPNPNCAFLAIDTSLNDLKSLKTVQLDERFSLYDAACVKLPANPPAFAKAWLNPAFPPNPLKSTGAEGTRQVARLMLCGTNKYDELRARIKRTVESIKNGNKHIMINIIAGISGGTGSGTIVDVAYMVHDVMAEMGIYTYELRGFLYLSDAQRHIPQISASNAKWKTLERNCYAALKEIDYFMTNGADKALEPIYQLKTQGRTVNSCKKIFDTGNCILVSSVMKESAVTDTDEIIERFANFITYIFTDMSGNRGNGQDILSDLCNFTRGQLPQWKNMYIKKSDSDNPTWAGYHYSAIGYSSLYIPRDEIFAYCANLVFVKMYDEWNNITLLNQESIDQQLAIKGLDSLDNVFKFVRKRMLSVDSIAKIKTKIGQDESAYPAITNVFLVRKTTNTDATMQEAANRASRVNKSLGTPATLEALVDAVANEILNEVKEYFDKFGPFYAIAMLSGLENKGIKGFTQRINDFKNGIPDKEKALTQIMKTAKAEMETEEEKRRKDLTPSEEENETFVNFCEKYTKACVDVFLIKKFKDILEKVESKLTDFNNKTYKVYTTTIEVLSEMLKTDSIFATDTTRTVNGKGEKFSFDAIGFKQSDAMREKFLKLFKNVVDDEHAEILANKFKDNMFKKEALDAWESAGEDQELFANNIREIFINFFSDYTKNTLEKFLVLANNDLDPKMTPQRLTEIWDATEASNEDDFRKREELLKNAAESMYSQLCDNSSIMMRSIISPVHIDSYLSSNTTCLIDSMPNINRVIQELHPDDTFTVADKDFRSSITRFELISGIPAATIHGMNEYAEAYYSAESTPATCIGRHMDEGEQGWDRNLPEIYGIDANKFYSEKGAVLSVSALETDTFRDYALYDRIKNCFNTGLDQGWITLKSDDKGKALNYVLHRVESVKDNYEEFKLKLKEQLINNDEADIWALAAVCSGKIDVSTIDFVPVDSLDCELDIVQLPSNEYEISDVHRLIRGNMILMNSLLDTFDEYSKDDSIIGIYKSLVNEAKSNKELQFKLDSFNDDVRHFVLMFCFDLIKFDKNTNLWLYRLKESDEFKVLAPLDNGMMKIDKESIYYLGFVSGYMTKKAEIDPNVDVLKNPKAPQNIYDDAEAFLKSDRMTNLVEDQKLKNLEKAVNASPYRDLYSYPYVANGKDSTFKNLNEFYTVFADYLKNYLPEN